MELSGQRLPVCLTIAGSDSGGGAGIQADLRTFRDRGCFGTSAITALTAQNPREVTAIHGVPPAMVVAQYRAVAAAFTLGAIKTGMLFAAPIIAALADALADNDVPLVVDPVMVATSGARLLEEDAVAALVGRFLPLATVITPNRHEAALLLGREVADAADDARELAARFGAAVLLKGGHAVADRAVDVLGAATGCWAFSTPWTAARSTHGTGCTLSAAIAAGLARGEDLVTAVRDAKAYVQAALEAAVCVGPDTWAMHSPAALDPTVVSIERL